ncbi:MAG: recombinase family protein [Litorimonas sp.]
MQKQYFGYVRVSTVKQGEGVSLEAQRDAIERYCVQHGLNVSQWFEEKETAAKQGRTVFTHMLTELNMGHADGLVIHKIDRSARNLRDWATIGELQDAGIDVHFAAESVDFTSRGGRLTADIQAVIAADFIRNLKDETRKGIVGRIKQGLYPHKAPLGYLDTGRGQPKAIDPERAHMVREMFALYSTGQYSLNSLTETMHTFGFRSKSGRKIYRAKIDQILSNPFMVGLVTDKRSGATYKGQHDAIIPAELFNKVQAVRKDRERKKSTRHNLLMRGLFHCRGCQNAMIGERQKGHVYYRCHTRECPSNSIREEAMSVAIIECLSKTKIAATERSQFSRWSAQWLTCVSDVPSRDTSAVSISKLEQELNTLTDKLLSGVIDDETYAKRKRSMTLRRQELEEHAKNRKSKDQLRRDCQQFLELLENLAGLYENAKPHEKRQMVELCFSNRTVHQKNVELTMPSWLETAST